MTGSLVERRFRHPEGTPIYRSTRCAALDRFVGFNAGHGGPGTGPGTGSRTAARGLIAWQQRHGVSVYTVAMSSPHRCRSGVGVYHHGRRARCCSWRHSGTIGDRCRSYAARLVGRKRMDSGRYVRSRMVASASGESVPASSAIGGLVSREPDGGDGRPAGMVSGAALG